MSKVHRKHDEGKRGTLRMRRKEEKRLERRRARFIELPFTMFGANDFREITESLKKKTWC